MTAAVPPLEEARRLEALHRLGVLDTEPEPVFDALTAAAADVCGVPIALVSLIDAERQWFKSNRGLAGVDGTPRSVAFCDHAIRAGAEVLEVGDAALDPRFASNPLVTGEPRIRFYAGAPIVLPGGEAIGTVCVIDREPRRLSDAQRHLLAHLGRIASATLAERHRQVEMARALADSEERYRAIVEDQSELISSADRDGILRFVNLAYAAHFGLEPAQMVGRSLYDFVAEADREAVREHLARVGASDAPVSNVNRMRSAEGRTRWVAWTNRVLRDAAGRPTALQSVGRDVTEQREAQQALAESERRLRSLYESTPAILHSIDAQGRLLDVSDLWLEVLGYSRDEVLGRPSSAFLSPESARRAKEQVLPAFFAAGRCDRVPYRFVCRDGGEIDVLLSAILERDAAGAPLRSLAVLEDVTERNRIAAELGATHARLDAIVENVPAMLGHWSRDGLTRFVNREFQAAVGLPMEHIVGRPLREVFEAVDPPTYTALAPRVAEVLQGRRQEFELPMLTIAGLRQLRLTLVPEQPRTGEVDGFYAMGFDITGRKALELRLSESELRYRSLFDHLQSGFALHEMVLDAEGRPVDYKFLALNAAFGAMTGLDPSQAAGRRVTELLPGIAADPADWIGTYGRVAHSGVPLHFEQRSADLHRWFEVVAYRPAPGQFAVIAQDITQRKLAQEQLQAALGEKETLLKEVYHRVKNNLQVVQSLLSLQRRALPEGAARAALEDSVQRVRAMALVHEKLYQSGNLAAVSLADYAQDLLKQIGEANGAAQRGIRLQAEVAPIETGLDNAIPFGLLLAELAGNALKHGFAGRAAGELRVRLERSDAGARLEVADDGAGLPPGFDLAGTRSMGLQLAGSLARQLGGELRAEFDTSAGSGAPRGAVFVALLGRL